MSRSIEVTFTQRQVRCRAVLLDDLAPRTCAVLWDALPLDGPAYHAKYARNEVYALVPAFGEDPGVENPTITPIPGDLVFFSFNSWQLNAPSHGYSPGTAPAAGERTVDLAVFYARNNLLLNPDFGFVPGNVFGAIEEGLAEFAEAAQDVWRGGAKGETIRFSRFGTGT